MEQSTQVKDTESNGNTSDTVDNSIAYFGEFNYDQDKIKVVTRNESELSDYKSPLEFGNGKKFTFAKQQSFAISRASQEGLTGIDADLSSASFSKPKISFKKKQFLNKTNSKDQSQISYFQDDQQINLGALGGSYDEETNIERKEIKDAQQQIYHKLSFGDSEQIFAVRTQTQNIMKSDDESPEDGATNNKVHHPGPKNKIQKNASYSNFGHTRMLEHRPFKEDKRRKDNRSMFNSN